MTAQREVWGRTLARLGKEDPSLLVLDGDLATSTRADLVAASTPRAFLQMGIAEQNLVGAAFGLTTMGFRPWISTFGVFLTYRALDQIRMLVSQTRAPVRLAGAYSGLLNGASGKTHQDLQDLAIMRGMPNLTVLAPGDEHEAETMTEWAAECSGPVYIRFARDAVKPLSVSREPFTIGSVRVLRDGGDACVISTGVQSSRVLDAAGMLADRGIRTRVVHVPTIKPLDVESLQEAVAGYTTLITVEEHSRIGGLGSLVSEWAAESGRMRVERIGLDDAWSESGPNDFLLEKYGLSAARVAGQIERFLDGVAAATSG